jgi:hypothetical protein
LSHIFLTFVSLALLLAVVAFLKERRIRLALQNLLRRLLSRWRNHSNEEVDSPRSPADRDDADRERMS